MNNKNKRQKDRHESGTGIGKELKKDGKGTGNWGKDGEEIEETKENKEEETPIEEVKVEEKVEEKPEEKQLSYQEYQNLLKEKEEKAKLVIKERGLQENQRRAKLSEFDGQNQGKGEKVKNEDSVFVLETKKKKVEKKVEEVTEKKVEKTEVTEKKS